MHNHITLIAHHLDETPEATAMHQWAGNPHNSKDGLNADRYFHNTITHEIDFMYSVQAYTHTTDISVTVKRYGIETRIMVPGGVPAAVIAHAAMSALRTTIDTITPAQQGAAA